MIEAGLLLRAVGPSTAVCAATLAAAAGDVRPLAAIPSAEDRTQAAALTCAALGAMLWPGPVLLEELDALESTLKGEQPG